MFEHRALHQPYPAERRPEIDVEPLRGRPETVVVEPREPACRREAPLRLGLEKQPEGGPGLGDDDEIGRPEIRGETEPPGIVLRLVGSAAATEPAPGGGYEFFAGENRS